MIGNVRKVQSYKGKSRSYPMAVTQTQHDGVYYKWVRSSQERHRS